MGAGRHGRARALATLGVVLAAVVVCWFVYDRDAAPPDASELGGDLDARPERGPTLHSAGRRAAASAAAGALIVETRLAGRPVSAGIEVERLGDVRARVWEPWADDWTRGTRVAGGTTAADGRIRFGDVAPGRYRVRASGVGAASRALTLHGDAVDTFLRLDLLTGPYEQRIRLLQGERPAAGWTLHLDVADDWSSADPIGLERPAWFARTDGNGRVHFRALPHGRMVIRAVSPTGHAITHPSQLLPTGHELVIDVSPPPEQVTLQVRALTGGAPIAGAEVTLVSEDETRVYEHRGRTDTAGRVSLPCSGYCDRLLVRANGFSPRWLYSVARRAMPSVIQLARTATVAGRVISSADGTPCAGARVWLVGQGPVTHGSRYVHADGEGRFAFPDAPAGTMQLHVWGGGWYSTALQTIHGNANPTHRSIAPGSVHEERLDASRTVSILGTLKLHDDRPVGGARIALRDATGIDGTLFLQTPRVVVTDERGGFVLEDLVPEAINHLEALIDGVPRGSTWFRANDLEGPLTWSLLETITVEIAVRDARTGDPLVHATARAGDGFGVTDEQLLTADAEGIIRLEHVVPDVTIYNVTADGYQPLPESLEVRFDHAEPTRVQRIDIELHPGEVILGRVVVPDGVPHTAVSLLLTHAEGEDTEVYLLATPAADGSFRFTGVAPGAHRLEGEYTFANRYGFAEIGVQAGTIDAELILGATEDDSGAWIVLRVRTPDGAGLVRGLASVARRDPDGDKARISHELIHNGFADLSRITALTRSTADEFYVAVVPHRDGSGLRPNLAPRVIGPLEDGAVDQEVTLRPGRVITGRVTGPSGQGVAGVHVGAQMAWPDAVRTESILWIGRSITDAEGRYRLPGMPAGEVDVLARELPRGWQKTHTRTVGANENSMDIVLQPAVEATVRVTDWRGRPVEGALVRWIPEREDYRSEEVFDTRTDDRGVAYFADLPPNERRLLIVVSPRGRGDTLTWRESGVPTGSRDVQLARGYALLVTVLEAEDRPVENATVRILDDDGSGWSAKGSTNARGQQLLERLPAGIVRLQADPRRGEAGPILAVDAASGSCVLRIGGR